MQIDIINKTKYKINEAIIKKAVIAVITNLVGDAALSRPAAPSSLTQSPLVGALLTRPAALTSPSQTSDNLVGAAVPGIPPLNPKSYILNPNLQISVALLPPHEIRALNKQYRGIDSVTDCLSFPMDDNNILGDIIICYERLLTQAIEIGNTPEKELAFLTIHSMLHLFGYDHMAGPDEQKMIAKQKEIMNIINKASLSEGGGAEGDGGSKEVNEIF